MKGRVEIDEDINQEQAIDYVIHDDVPGDGIELFGEGQVQGSQEARYKQNSRHYCVPVNLLALIIGINHTKLPVFLGHLGRRPQPQNNLILIFTLFIDTFLLQRFGTPFPGFYTLLIFILMLLRVHRVARGAILVEAIDVVLLEEFVQVYVGAAAFLFQGEGSLK